MPNPTGIGGFKKGQSGNPGGRSGKDISDLSREARRYAALAVSTLVKICRAGQERNRLAAATALLDRGYGKPLQAFQIDGAFAAKKLNELSDVELATLEARLASREEAGEPIDDLFSALHESSRGGQQVN
jgi:hypothetical protein